MSLDIELLESTLEPTHPRHKPILVARWETVEGKLLCRWILSSE